MRPEALDVERTVEYAHMHDMARRALPWALFAVLLGLFILTPLDGTPDREATLIGGLVVAGALAFIGVLAYRQTQPNVAHIVLSPRGILFRDVSDQIIPWREMIAVAPKRVTGSKDIIGARVVAITVSQRFFQTLTPRTVWQSTIALKGSPTEIYLAYYHNVPIDELTEAVLARWRAFSGRYQDTASAREMVTRAAQAATPPPAERASLKRGSGVVQRGSSFEGARALVALVSGASLGQAVLMAVPIVGIIALATNNLGLWSTEAQIVGRAKQQEWREFYERQERERRELDAQMKRTDEMWDKTFKCMNEYWDQHGRGKRGDPDCMKDGK